MVLIIVSFLAGVLSVLAPCVLPVIPVIFGGSLSSNSRSKSWRIITAMMISIVLFTLLLKVSTMFINVDPQVRVRVSSSIIILYGLMLVRPGRRESIFSWLRLSRVHNTVDRASDIGGLRGDILLGASLGPIFSTCSPTYVILFSTVLPTHFTLAIFCMIAYVIGFGGLLALLVRWWRSLVRRLYGLSDSRGAFKRTLWIILVMTWVLILSGGIKKLEVLILDYLPNATRIEQYIIEKTNILGVQDTGIAWDPDSGWQKFGDSEMERLLNANYPAPDLQGLTGRINSSGYQSLSQLRWKVVIIDFWTYSCINCIRTLPHIQTRHEKYSSSGLVIIWVHAPEFVFERQFDNVRKASKDFGLTYAIAQDNDYMTWRNYTNHYRPAKYIIDREGKVRYTHFGEGEYETSEQVIQYLLGITHETVEDDIGILLDEMDSLESDLFTRRTPETYLGTARRDKLSDGATQESDYWWLEWQRESDNEKITLQSQTWSIAINAVGREVNLVLGTVNGSVATGTIWVDGILTRSIGIDGHQLYNLHKSTISGKHTVVIKFDVPGIQAYAYTFG